MSIAICPGSFDPVTLGHMDIIARSSRLFDKVYAVALINSGKEYMFPKETRLEMLRRACAGLENVVVDDYDGLLADYAASKNASAIVKGVRSFSDFQYEQTMANANKYLAPDVETMFLNCNPALAHVSSTFARVLIKQKRPVDGIVPSQVMGIIEKRNLCL